MANRHIVVAGAGGNTGSHLLPHLARMSGISRLTLVDPDTYEAANLSAQNINGTDVGRGKVSAQAAKLQQINPQLELAAIQGRIEDIPRGLLKSELIASCLDSKIARQHVNEIAWRLGIPHIVDCGVLGSENLVRVNVYVTSLESPCLECSWSDTEYALVEQEYMCGVGGTAFPSLASSALGAMAASLAAIEITKLLSGTYLAAAVGKQVVLDAQHHSLTVTRIRRNSSCRFDHQSWAIEPWVCRPEATTVWTMVKELGNVRVDGHNFVRELVCPACGHEKGDTLQLNRPLARCSECNRRMASSRLGELDCLSPELLADIDDQTLAQLGVQIGDVVSCGTRHYQIVGAA